MIKRKQRLNDEPTPFAGYVILFTAGFVMAAMIIILGVG